MLNVKSARPNLETMHPCAYSAPDTWTEDAGCAAYYAVQSGDICNTILETYGTAFGTTLDTFYTINPSVDSECSNLKPGWAYCVGLMKPANAWVLSSSHQ